MKRQFRLFLNIFLLMCCAAVCGAEDLVSPAVSEERAVRIAVDQLEHIREKQEESGVFAEKDLKSTLDKVERMNIIRVRELSSLIRKLENARILRDAKPQYSDARKHYDNAISELEKIIIQKRFELVRNEKLEELLKKQVELRDELKKYYLWSPLLSKQINTMKMMFHYQIKEFDKVDALIPKSLFFDPVSSAMKLARMYKKNNPQLDKFAKGKLKRAKGDSFVVLYALYSWILVKQNRINEAVKVLAESKKRCDNEVLNANWERLVNGKEKNFSNAALGEMWYMLHLEEPKVKTQRMRPQF